MRSLYQSFARMAEAIPYAVIALIARFAGAIDFWRSGQSKLQGDAFLGVKWNIFDIAEKKFFLFENVYGIPGPIAPAMTHAAAIGEFFLPLMLVFGLFTRFGALGLLAMTAFIQFYVYPEELLKLNGNWSTHLLWTAPLLLILARGPGAISLDAVLGKKL
jgi:putative oxidoreductase